MLCIHDGPMLSLFDGTSGQQLAFPPRWLLPEHRAPIRERSAKRYKSLMEFCQARKPRTVCAMRTYALGDVLMLIPVLKAFRRAAGISKPILLVTAHDISDGLGGLAWDADVRVGRALGMRTYGADVHINMDWCLEVDHRGGPESDMHRCDIYAGVIGL